MLTTSAELIRYFKKMEIEVRMPESLDHVMYVMMFQLKLIEKIRPCQEKLMIYEKDKLSGEEIKTQKYDKGIYRFASRIWIPNVTKLE